jgi:hypothetical protein
MCTLLAGRGLYGLVNSAGVPALMPVVEMDQGVCVTLDMAIFKTPTH